MFTYSFPENYTRAVAYNLEETEGVTLGNFVVCESSATTNTTLFRPKAARTIEQAYSIYDELVSKNSSIEFSIFEQLPLRARRPEVQHYLTADTTKLTDPLEVAVVLQIRAEIALVKLSNALKYAPMYKCIDLITQASDSCYKAGRSLFSIVDSFTQNPEPWQSAAEFYWGIYAELFEKQHKAASRLEKRFANAQTLNKGVAA